MTDETVATRLAKFAAWALEEVTSGYEVDGGDAQAKLIELDLATVAPYDAEVHGTEMDADPGDDIVLLADEVKVLLAAGER